MGNERENISIQLYNRRGEDFPVSQGAPYIQYGIVVGDLLRGFLRNVFPLAGEVAASFLGSLLQKGEEGQIWGNGAKESILRDAGTVLNEAANREKQGQLNRRKYKN